MHSIGIDIGKRQHVAAICRDGTRTAEKAILRFGSDRAGLTALEQWLSRQGPIDRVVIRPAPAPWPFSGSPRPPRRAVASGPAPSPTRIAVPATERSA